MVYLVFLYVIARKELTKQSHWLAGDRFAEARDDENITPCRSAIPSTGPGAIKSRLEAAPTVSLY